MVLEKAISMLFVTGMVSPSAGEVDVTVGAKDGIESESSTLDTSDSFQYRSSAVTKYQ